MKETELAAMRYMIEDLSQAIHALQQQEHSGTCMEIPEGDHNPFDLPKGGLEGELDDVEDENPFHDAGTVDLVARGRSEQQLVHPLDLSNSGIKVECFHLHGKMHLED